MIPVTSDEVKCAVFTMHPDKSPEFDGLNPDFFSILLEDYRKRYGSSVNNFSVQKNCLVVVIEQYYVLFQKQSNLNV